MQKWKKHAALGALKSVLPFQGIARRVRRAVSPYRTNPENDPGLLGQSLRQIAALAAAGISAEGKTVVEIGTGWLPVLPLVYRMAGAERVISVDPQKLADRHTMITAIEFVRDNLCQALERTGASPALFDPSRGDGSGIDLRAPFDFNRLPNACADLIVSRTVLEHIPEAALHAILRHSRSVLKPGGLLCHIIDMSDHFEHFDKSISRLNFLRYEPLAWRMISLGLPQNRLRLFEYETMLREQSFEIISATGTPDTTAMDALRQMRLCRRYRHADPRALAILTSTIIARPHRTGPTCREFDCARAPIIDHSV